MATRSQGRPAYLVSQNKKIRLWHCHLTYISNTQVIRALKLVDGIDLGSNKYNLVKVFIDSDDSKASTGDENNNNISRIELIPFKTITTLVSHSLLHTIESNKTDLLDKLCTPCVGNKSTYII